MATVGVKGLKQRHCETNTKIGYRYTHRDCVWQILSHRLADVQRVQ